MDQEQRQEWRNIRRKIADKLMDAFGVKDRRIIWSFLNHCDSEQDMEHTLRILRRDSTKSEGWFW